MRIAVDTAGGDKAPNAQVKGVVEALQAADTDDLGIVLTGDRGILEGELSKFPKVDNISIVHSGEVVQMHESPSYALRRKRNSSIAVAMALAKKGEVEAVISAGNTGAAVASSLGELGALKHVRRPAIASVFPTEKGKPCLVLDVGANLQCKPGNLLQFAVMGSVYVDCALGIQAPKIGLLNIGEESSKGNELTIKSHNLLAGSDLNFIGNVEGRDILRGTADVVVCDGFVGNIILKFTESITGMFYQMIKEESGENLSRKLGALLLKPVFKGIGRKMDYEEYGGAPLLGVDGVTIICHGSSSSKAICNAVKVAKRTVEGRINDHIKEALDHHYTLA